jgi:hypothetical protein
MYGIGYCDTLYISRNCNLVAKLFIRINVFKKNY